MTVESLMNRFTEYVSWLYFGREWARWELQTIAVTALILLLFILLQRRKAKAGRIVVKQIEKRSSSLGINLDAGKAVHQESEGKTMETRSDGRKPQKSGRTFRN